MGYRSIGQTSSGKKRIIFALVTERKTGMKLGLSGVCSVFSPYTSSFSYLQFTPQ